MQLQNWLMSNDAARDLDAFWRKHRRGGKAAPPRHAASTLSSLRQVS